MPVRGAHLPQTPPLVVQVHSWRVVACRGVSVRLPAQALSTVVVQSPRTVPGQPSPSRSILTRSITESDQVGNGLDERHAGTPPRLAARRTIYKGIGMRSRTEARFAAWLDRNGFDWQYEPHVFGNQEDDYLPDFAIRGFPALPGHDILFPQTTSIYVEIKGPKPDPPALQSLMEQMEVIWSTEPCAYLVICGPWAVETGPALYRFPLGLGVGGRFGDEVRSYKTRLGWTRGVFSSCGFCERVSLYRDDGTVAWACSYCGLDTWLGTTWGPL